MCDMGSIVTVSGAGIAEQVSALDWLSLRYGNHYAACFEHRLVPLSKVLYHTCFICGQRCKWWSRPPKLTLSVISDVKPIIYVHHLAGQLIPCLFLTLRVPVLCLC